MKKFILLAMFIIFWIIFTLCYRDFPQNHQDSPEGSYITDLMAMITTIDLSFPHAKIA